MSAAEEIEVEVEVDADAETWPAPNAHTDELALELEKLALAGLNKHAQRPPSFQDGWRCGVRDAAQYVSDYGKREVRSDP